MALYEKYQDQVEFIVVDVDTAQSRNLIQQYSVQYIPAMFFIDSQGKVKNNLAGDPKYETGRPAEEVLEENIQAILNGL